VFVVRNDSDQPIYRVRIVEHEPELPLIPAHDARVEAMTADEAKSFGFSTPAYDGPYPVSVVFSDAAAVRWLRRRDGFLQKAPRGLRG
jgi:hypothetical protein